LKVKTDLLLALGFYDILTFYTNHETFSLQIPVYLTMQYDETLCVDVVRLYVCLSVRSKFS